MSTLSQLQRHGLFDARVPRYTSYPTANHFSANVGPPDMPEWLSAVPAGAAVSLYMHVPFCRRLCWFCACRTQGTSSGTPVRAYAERLKRELEIVMSHLPSGVRLSRLHWGGGTPTLMDPDIITDMAATIKAALPFADNAEFSVEIDPCEIDDARMDALAEAGLTRASIGIQDFNPDIQTMIGRIQSFETTRVAAEGLRARGIESLNVDLLYGLPAQTIPGMSQTVQKVLSLAPDRVALYGYAHVPWMARRQALIPTDELPGPQDRLALFESAATLFSWDGLMDIGIDHFARPEDGLARAAKAGTLRRNFQGYTDDQAEVLIGLGASSISRFPQGYAQNAPATSAWGAAIEEGRLSTSRGHTMSADDTLRAAAIERLMCDFKVSFQRLADDTGESLAVVEAIFKGVPEAFEGAVDRKPDGIEIRPKSWALTRMVARALDAYDVKSEGHSLAI